MPTGRASLLPSLRRVVLARETAERSDADLLAAFARDRDGDAFAELVHRHGPMVLGVCRRVVGDHHAAEDAFQAAFLVLARRATAVRPRSALGGWLYGVAYRTASKARAVLARRRTREKQVNTMPEPPTSPLPEDVWSDVRPVIDEELARLPDRLRLPVVLCDLEGRPQRQVAKHLGVSQPTLAGRLASARRLLAGRLTRRGVALSGGALAGVLCGNASAAVAPRLADGLARAAEAVSAGAPVSSLVSAHAIQLSEGVMRMMLVAKLRTIGTAALAALALVTGLGTGLVPAHADDPKPDQAPGTNAPNAKKQPATPADDATFFRRVCLDLRGTAPTSVESGYFAADRDANKRRKVVDWLLTDDAVKAFVANKLGVPADRVRSITLRENIAILVDASASVEKPRAVVVSPDGKYVQAETTLLSQSNAAVTGRTILNETPIDLGSRLLVHGRTTLGRTDAITFDPDTRLLVTPPKPTVGIIYELDLRFTQDLPVATDQSIVELFVDEGELSEGVIRYSAGDVSPRVESDAEFLRKAVRSARGMAPSAVEEKYFAEDKDPKKREKLLDLLLKDPAVAKKLGDDWKKNMLESPPQDYRAELRGYYYRVTPTAGTKSGSPIRKQQPGRLEQLVGELVGAKKSDEQVLDGVSLVVLGRLPTESEKKLTLAAVGKAADKRAAWVEVAKALSATEEAKKYVAELNKANPGPAKPPEKK